MTGLLCPECQRTLLWSDGQLVCSNTHCTEWSKTTRDNTALSSLSAHCLGSFDRCARDRRNGPDRIRAVDLAGGGLS